MGSGYFTSLARSLFPPLIPETAAQQNEFNNIVAPLAEWEATNHLEQLGDRPLLLWHGLDDDVVPADESLRLQQALSETGRDKLLTCSWQPGVRHRITPEALDAAVTFFRQHLYTRRMLTPCASSCCRISGLAFLPVISISI